MLSRRGFLGSVASVAAAAGVKAADLPNLTIKEVKAYVTSNGSLASIVTEGGIEGNYTLVGAIGTRMGQRRLAGIRQTRADGQERAGPARVTPQWDPPKRRLGQSSYASAIDDCLWDITGQGRGPAHLPDSGRVPRPCHGLRQFAAPKTVEEFRDRGSVQMQGGRIHGPTKSIRRARRTEASNVKLDMEVCKAVRQGCGRRLHIAHGPGWRIHARTGHGGRASAREAQFRRL